MCVPMCAQHEALVCGGAQVPHAGVSASVRVRPCVPEASVRCGRAWRAVCGRDAGCVPGVHAGAVTRAACPPGLSAHHGLGVALLLSGNNTTPSVLSRPETDTDQVIV